MQRGVNLPLYGDDPFTMAGLGQTLDQYKADSGQYVAVNVCWFQNNINSTVIQPNYSLFSVDDALLNNVIDAIQARGLKVVLKPMVNLSNDSGHWRGQIVGGSTWFNGTNGYNDFLRHYATIARDQNVDMFEVGTELGGTNGQTADWKNAVSIVKGIYGGKLTYAANWDSGTNVIQGQVAWWDVLDYIGIDAYYQLSGSTLAAKKAAWAAQANTINTWYNALPVAQRKPILFTEVGYDNTDAQAQADWYEALMSTLWKQQPWFKGVYWWDWQPADPAHHYDGLTFQDLPAEQVVAGYYSVPEPSTLGLGLSVISILSLRRRRH